MSTTSPPLAVRLLKTAEVSIRTGLSRSTIWRLERAGQFPPRRELSPARVAWLSTDIDAWIQSRAIREAI